MTLVVVSSESDPKFNPLEILEKNGGCMPFWDLFRSVVAKSREDPEVCYNRIMELIKNGRIQTITLRKEKRRSRYVRKLLGIQSQRTWVAKDRKAAIKFLMSLYDETRDRISSSDISQVQKGAQTRAIRDFCNSILIQQLNLKPYEIEPL